MEVVHLTEVWREAGAVFAARAQVLRDVISSNKTEKRSGPRRRLAVGDGLHGKKAKGKGGARARGAGVLVSGRGWHRSMPRVRGEGCAPCWLAKAFANSKLRYWFWLRLVRAGADRVTEAPAEALLLGPRAENFLKDRGAC